ncbi:MAG: hypothetical protein J6S21_00760 [Victivallales bacterium]|nr:hypothetical protein [Victivallales bacterium]
MAKKKESVQEFARRESARLKRDNGPMLTRWKVLWTPLLLLAIPVLAFSLPEIMAAAVSGREERIAAAVSLLLSVVFFSFVPLLPVYVFGHEMTHWLAAKCFFRKTGKLTLKRASGALEVPGTNWVIVLAPYCFPLYFFIAAGICAFIALYVTPPQIIGGEALFTAVPTLCYGYHLALTCRALRHGQEDIRYCGGFFAAAAVTFGNLFFLYLTLIVSGALWQEAFRIPDDKVTSAANWMLQCVESLSH